MRIITTPWKNELLELVSTAKKSIKIISPLVKENICQELILSKQSQTKFELITTFKFSHFYSNKSDLSAFETLMAANGKIKINPRIHSNIYLFDDKKAIITSANFSDYGLLNNFEYGIFLEDKILVAQVLEDYNIIAKHQETRAVKKAELDIIQKILMPIHKNTTERKLRLSKFEVDHIKETFDVVDAPIEAISAVFEGWQLEVFNCINLTQQQVFTLAEVNLFENHLKKIFPSLKNIPEKIEIQIKYFLDLGLINFLGDGFYKKLWR